MSDRRPKKPRRHLPVLEAGKRYTGWMGFVAHRIKGEGEPDLYSTENYYDGVLRVDVFATKKSALRCYEDVRRVTIIVEVKDE